MVDIVTEEMLSGIVKENGIVLVDVFADWCPPCRRMAPVLDAFAERHPECRVVKVDADRNEGICREFRIRYIPTLMLYKEGKVVGSRSGSVSLEDLEAWVESVKDGGAAPIRKGLKVTP